jgi:hypothetical protein
MKWQPARNPSTLHIIYFIFSRTKGKLSWGWIIVSVYQLIPNSSKKNDGKLSFYKYVHLNMNYIFKLCGKKKSFGMQFHYIINNLKERGDEYIIHHLTWYYLTEQYFVNFSALFFFNFIILHCVDWKLNLIIYFVVVFIWLLQSQNNILTLS